MILFGTIILSHSQIDKSFPFWPQASSGRVAVALVVSATLQPAGRIGIFQMAYGEWSNLVPHVEDTYDRSKFAKKVVRPYFCSKGGACKLASISQLSLRSCNIGS